MPLPPGLEHCRFTADDWGLSPGVNRAMLDLARRGLLARISILANGAHLAEGLDELSRLSGVKTGLHFNLSYGPILSELAAQGGAALALADRKATPSGDVWVYPGSLGRAALRMLRVGLQSRKRLSEAVQSHLRQQLQELRSRGVEVDYVDGHHHVQALPGMLDAMAPVLKAYGIRRIRVPFDARLLWTRRAALPIVAWPTLAAARRLGLETLPFHYPLAADLRDGARWRRRLAALGGRGPVEVLVHPATQDDVGDLAYPDPYGAGRVNEYEALLGLQGPPPEQDASGSSRAGAGS